MLCFSKHWFLVAKSLLPFIILLGSMSIGFSQNSLFLRLSEARQKMLQNNLSLVAAKYGVTAQQAQVIQAGLLSNPTLHMETPVFTGENKRWFDNGTNGQKLLTFSQVILLAGKRNKAISLQTNYLKAAEAGYFDLVRSLNAQLESLYIQLYFNLEKQKLFQSQRDTLSKVTLATAGQANLGNVSAREVVRLEALELSLNKSLNELQLNELDLQANLKSIIGEPVSIRPALPKDSTGSAAFFQLNYLEDSVLIWRQDLKSTYYSMQAQEANIKLQKALAVPDLQFGYTFDQGSNYKNNYNGFNVDINLPFFNRNQGNIKTAQANLGQLQSQFDFQKLQVKNQTNSAFNQYNLSQTRYKTINLDFMRRREGVITGCLINYRLRNITLLDFLDCYDSHREASIDLLDLQAGYLQSISDLNYTLGKSLIPIN